MACLNENAFRGAQTLRCDYVPASEQCGRCRKAHRPGLYLKTLVGASYSDPPHRTVFRIPKVFACSFSTAGKNLQNNATTCICDV